MLKQGINEREEDEQKEEYKTRLIQTNNSLRKMNTTSVYMLK